MGHMSTHTTTPDQAPSSPLLTERELAARWQVAEGTLANRRSAGTSPVPYIRPLGRVRYRLDDVLAYERAQERVA